MKFYALYIIIISQFNVGLNVHTPTQITLFKILKSEHIHYFICTHKI